MNLLEELEKKLRTLSLLCCVLMATSCAHPPPEAMPTLVSEKPNPAEEIKLTSSFSMIDRKLAETYPHLRTHQGQILLAWKTWQFVMASVPPLAQQNPLQALFTQSFQWQKGGWIKAEWQAPLLAVISTSDGKTMELIGQDLEKNGKSITLVSHYALREQRQQTATLEWDILPEGEGFSLTLKHKLPQQNLQMQLEIPLGIADINLIPLGQNQSIGLSLSRHPEVLSLLSRDPFASETNGTHMRLQSTAIDAKGKLQWYFLPGTQGALMQIPLALRIRSCHKQFRDKEIERESCLKSLPKFKEGLNLSLPDRSPDPTRVNAKKIYQIFFAHAQDGAFLSSFSILEGEAIRLPSRSSRQWELFFPDEQGALKKMSCELSKDKKDCRLPPLALGKVRINLQQPEPLFIEIRDRVRKLSNAYAAFLSAEDRLILSPYAFLQTTWPFEAELPAGDYSVRLFHGLQQVCQQPMTLAPGQKWQLSCQHDRPPLTLSRRYHLGPATLDLQEEERKVLGLEAQARGKDRWAIGDIEQFRVSDPEIGLSLRAFPADSALKQAWLDGNRREGESILRNFSQFIRQHFSDRLLILECPQGLMSREEYEWIALKLKPDYLELFACRTAERYFEVVQSLQQKAKTALKILPAQEPENSGYYPALFLPDRGLTGSQSLATRLRQGDYSVGYRNEIILAEDKIQRLSPNLLSLQVQLRGFDIPSQASLLRIYDQNGLLLEQALAPTRAFEQLVSLQIKLGRESRFLRIELLSQTGKDSPLDLAAYPTFVLATSNFFLIPHGETQP